VGRRQYQQQDCGLAVALDLLGQRWTLLIVRELVLGPLRYTDLLSRLDGIGTNLLAARLRHLEEIGVVHRTDLPPPAASTVYQLTELGRELEPALVRLAQWGQRFLPPDGAPFDARRAAFALRVRFHAEDAPPEPETYQYEVDSQLLYATIGAGLCRTGLGPADKDGPTAVLRTDPGTFFALLEGQLSWEEALASRKVEADGDDEAARRAIDVFRIR
jgi:DNA-binding HxlR family transcriptional regulator